MAFIHKNVNSALLMLIAFISVSLVTATVYSVEAFDSLNQAYAEKAMQVDSLSAELAHQEAKADSLKQTAQLTQEREKALADMIEQQRQETQESAGTITVPTEPAKKASYNSGTAAPNPYRKRVWGGGWVPPKKYVI